MFVFVWFSWWWWWWLLVCWTLSGSLCSLSLFYLVCLVLLLLSSSLFKLLLFPLSGSGDKNFVSALVSYRSDTDIVGRRRRPKQKDDGKLLLSLAIFCLSLPPPSVIRTDHSGWDSLRLLISSFIHSDDRSHFPIIHFHIFSLGITGGPINYRRLKNGSARLFSNHFFCSISKCFSL